MIGSVEQLLRNSKRAVCKRDLPRRCCTEKDAILVVIGTVHINNHRIAVFKHAPARDSGTLHVEPNKIRPVRIQVAHVKRRLTRCSFQTSAKGNTHPVGRNFGMVHVDCISDFHHRQHRIGIINISQVSRKIITESKFRPICPGNRMHYRRACNRNNPASANLAIFSHPGGRGNRAKCNTESHVIGTSRGSYRVDIATAIQSNGRGLISETAALHDPLSQRAPIRSPDKICHGGIAKIAKPVVHPFHGVAGHITELAIRSKVADGMQLVI